jgi:hypothetical protein
VCAYREPEPKRLEQSREPRVAQQQLARMEIAVHYLEHAQRLRRESGYADEPDLKGAIKRAKDACLSLRAKSEGRIVKRRRPRSNPTAETCWIYLDECGQHVVSAHDDFAVFVLAAVIIRESDRERVETEWRLWKAEYLGSADEIVHEPDIRRGDGPFYGERATAAIEALPAILGSLDFMGFAVVVHRDEYVAQYGTGPLDESLPDHAYLLALDVLMERVALALDSHYDGARGQVIAESRGAKEDAQLQHEFARLHLDGTSYIAPGWFRQQLCPGIRFLGKADNSTGLQLADLLARPAGEKVADPASTPPRWEIFREKLAPGVQTKNSPLGLKIVPWDEKYKDLWKS